ncbi:MAG: hypothetical protein JWL90_2627 [Chthoniobacteraceae bacterium]|nr:hypothetical protein [Chthoniobacteraceae bacterium]
MNTDPQISLCTTASVPPGFCRKLANALILLKEELRAKYEQELPGHQQLVGDLIAEADALARQTPFPHLFLPDFAEERLAGFLANQELVSKAA